MERTGILVKLPLGIAAAVAVALGSWGGLVRIGWSLGSPPAAAWHGPLFALGLLGTMIGMERAVGFGKAWPWAAPALCAAAVAAMVAGEPRPASLLLTGGGGALIAVFAAAYRIDANTPIVVMGLGRCRSCWPRSAGQAGRRSSRSCTPWRDSSSSPSQASGSNPRLFPRFCQVDDLRPRAGHRPVTHASRHPVPALAVGTARCVAAHSCRAGRW